MAKLPPPYTKPAEPGGQTVCVQCALKALVEGGDPIEGIFDEAPEAHRQRVHPDLEACRRERRDLEARLMAQIAESGLDPETFMRQRRKGNR